MKALSFRQPWAELFLQGLFYAHVGYSGSFNC